MEDRPARFVYGHPGWWRQFGAHRQPIQLQLESPTILTPPPQQQPITPVNAYRRHYYIIREPPPQSPFEVCEDCGAWPQVSEFHPADHTNHVTTIPCNMHPHYYARTREADAEWIQPEWIQPQQIQTQWVQPQQVQQQRIHIVQPRFHNVMAIERRRKRQREASDEIQRRDNDSRGHADKRRDSRRTPGSVRQVRDIVLETINQRTPAIALDSQPKREPSAERKKQVDADGGKDVDREARRYLIEKRNDIAAFGNRELPSHLRVHVAPLYGDENSTRSSQRKPPWIEVDRDMTPLVRESKRDELVFVKKSKRDRLLRDNTHEVDEKRSSAPRGRLFVPLPSQRISKHMAPEDQALVAYWRDKQQGKKEHHPESVGPSASQQHQGSNSIEIQNFMTKNKGHGKAKDARADVKILSEEMQTLKVDDNQRQQRPSPQKQQQQPQPQQQQQPRRQQQQQQQHQQEPPHHQHHHYQLQQNAQCVRGPCKQRTPEKVIIYSPIREEDSYSTCSSLYR